MAEMMTQAVLIAGPTGVGKSIVAATIAARLGGEIINADSMQVYADLCVLTARPTPHLRSMATHHLYGFVDGAAEYGMANWLTAVSDTLDRILKSGRIPIFVGGTGLYLSALERGYEPTARRIIRVSDEGANLPYGWSKQGAYVRSPPSRLRGRSYLQVDRIFRFVLERSRTDLYRRINDNFAHMADTGAVDEVARLLERELPPNKPVMKALGVRELAAYIKGEIVLSEAIDLGQRNSRKFARRQITWFKNQMKDWKFVSANEAEDIILSNFYSEISQEQLFK